MPAGIFPGTLLEIWPSLYRYLRRFVDIIVLSVINVVLSTVLCHRLGPRRHGTRAGVGAADAGQTGRHDVGQSVEYPRRRQSRLALRPDDHRSRNVPQQLQDGTTTDAACRHCRERQLKQPKFGGEFTGTGSEAGTEQQR